MAKNRPMRRANGTGSVYFLGKRRRRPWVAMTSKMVDGKVAKSIVGYFETKADAETALSINKIKPASKKADYTLKELYDEWSALKYTGDLSKDTINNYKAGWKYLEPLQNIKFVELRAGEYQAVVDLAAKEKSRSTLEKIKTVAVMLSEYAMQNDIISQNYGSYIKLPRASRSTKTSFTHEEIEKIEKAASDGVPFADCILMLCYTGFRITEFLGLKVSDYDTAVSTLQGGIKTEAGKNRIIPVHPKILPYVQRWAQKCGERLICKDDGSKYTSKYFRESCYSPALKSIEGVRKLDPHECRHTFASLLHAAGVSQKTIMELMGHSDPDVDMKTYIHVDVKQLEEAIGKI